jgi:hypothetical protein
MYTHFGIQCIFNVKAVSEKFLMQIKPWHKNTQNKIAQNNATQTQWLKNKMEKEVSEDGFTIKPLS